MPKNQDWFNKKYSKEENLDIVESERLKLKGFLKVKNFTKLKRIRLEKFELTKLEISGCSQLTQIELTELSLLRSISITNCPNLITLNCSSTGLTSLEISNCPEFDWSKLPKLRNLSVTDCQQLTSLDCSTTELTSLEIINCPQLKKIIDSSKSTDPKSLYVRGYSNLTEFDCLETDFTRLKISDCSQIDLTNFPKITSLSVIECSNLIKLHCSSAQLTSLEIINCTQLKKITDSFSSKLKSLCVRGYSNLTELDCSETGFTSLKIIGCSEINDVNLTNLPEITNLSVIDCSKLTKFYCSSTVLNNLVISECYRLKEADLSRLPNLKSLSVTDCPKLTKLDCSSINTLTELGVSDLPELNCSNTSIKELSLNLCPYITKLDCSNNSELINIDVSNCFKLQYIDCSNCSNSNFTHLDLSYCPKSIKVNPSDLNIIRKKENIKNILIVGRTGSGKSALANVLTNTNEFKESAYALSETRNFKKQEFKWKENNFRVVDTIGVSNTSLALKDVLYKIADGIYSMPEGISQVLFVFNGGFKKEEINTFNIIKDFILEINIIEYITLVKTKFVNFRIKEDCEKDIDKMKNESDSTIKKIVESVNRVIHVDNPSVNIEAADDADDDNDYIVTQIKVNKKTREQSRKKLLDYLEDAAPIKENKYFKLKTWDKLRDKIKTITEHNKDDDEILQEMSKSDPELIALYNASEKLCLIL
ncbi:hypothetical protein RclHR1_04540015 [Rhizophagus clarus]|uniref:T9SS type A sorting domain-containing protein n=1 Tax=Rhizophagus clarus TaxID=94130 RepID=A0A2Z6RJL2_9GLOM|nr:hypothetical protein RclHR1_04540015 [Rhizophagus clarus]GES90134.1 T9SS type A sorting domain-containing protein [Rhizophagus clarus]